MLPSLCRDSWGHRTVIHTYLCMTWDASIWPVGGERKRASHQTCQDKKISVRTYLATVDYSLTERRRTNLAKCLHSLVINESQDVDNSPWQYLFSQKCIDLECISKCSMCIFISSYHRSRFYLFCISAHSILDFDNNLSDRTAPSSRLFLFRGRRHRSKPESFAADWLVGIDLINI